MKVIKTGLTLFGAFIAVMILVAIFSIGHAANKDQANSDRAANGWSQMHTGMTESEVSSLLGEPNDKTSSNVGGTVVDDWMYGVLADHTYDVTFEDGTVFSFSKI